MKSTAAYGGLRRRLVALTATAYRVKIVAYLPMSWCMRLINAELIKGIKRQFKQRHATSRRLSIDELRPLQTKFTTP